MSKNTILALILGLMLSIFVSSRFIPAFQKPISAFETLQKNSVEVSAKTLIQPTAEEKLGTILFVSDKTGNKEIYKMNLDTKTVTNLTNNSAQDMNPQVSPNGKFIVFYSNRSGQNKIYRMNIFDRTLTQLTTAAGDDYDPSYSPDGQKIVFKSTRDDGKGDIFIMNEDGSNQTNLTKNRSDTEEWDPTFNNDGTKIYFVVRQDSHLTDELYSMNIDGSNVIQLTKNTVPDWYPTINKVTGQLLYISKQKENTNDALFIYRANGNSKRLTNNRGNDADPSWNADGTKIVFINDATRNYDLYLMNADGSGLEKIMATPENELSPIFLPN